MQIELTDDVTKRLTGLTLEEFQGKVEEGDDAAAKFLELANARAKKLAEEKIKQGTRTKAKAVENALKPLLDKFGIDAGDNVDEAIESLTTAIEASAGTTASDLTKEKLLTNPLVNEIVADRTKALAQKVKDAEAAAAQQVAQLKRQTVQDKATAAIAAFLRDNNANLGQSTPEQAAQIALKLIGVDNIDLDDQGKLIPLNGGQPAKDDFGDALKLEDIVKQTWTFGFNAADPSKKGGGAPPAGTGKQGAQGGNAYSHFTNENQLKDAINAERDPAKRADMFKRLVEIQTA